MPEHLTGLIAASLLLVAIPGPNVALIVASSLRHGRRQGLQAVAGTTIGLGLQLLVVVLGYQALLGTVAAALGYVRWAGVLYLIWLGLRAMRSGAEVAHTAARRPRNVTRGALLALVNPKTLLFSAAFLPQFLPGDPAAIGTLPLLASVYLTVVACGDATWALCAAAARAWLQRHAVLHRRLTAAMLLGAGATLALARGRQ